MYLASFGPEGRTLRAIQWILHLAYRTISWETTTMEHKHRQSARSSGFSPTGNIGGPIESFLLFLDARRATFSLSVLTAGIMVVIADGSRTLDDSRKQDVIKNTLDESGSRIRDAPY